MRVKVSVRTMLMLVAVGVVLLGCGPAAFTEEPKFKGVVLNWGTIKAAYESVDRMRTLIREWERETGALVNIIFLPHPGSQVKMVLDFRAGAHTYDLGTINYPNAGQFMGGGMLLPLDKILKDPSMRPADVEGFIPRLLHDYGMWEGKTYGFPLHCDGRVFGCRKDVFEKYGKTFPAPAGPTGWREYNELAAFFNGKDWDNDGKKEYGCAVRMKGAIISVGRLLSRLEDFGGFYLDEETWEMNFANEKGVAALETFIDQLKWSPPDTLAYGFAGYNATYYQGRVPMLEMWQGAAQDALNPEKSVAWDKTTWAQIPGGHALLGGFGIGIFALTKHPKAAYDFMAWLTSPEICLKRAREGVVYISMGRSSVYHDPEVLKKFPFMSILAQNLAKGSALPRIPESDEMIEVLGREIAAALVGEKAPLDALKFAEKEWKRILRESGYIK